MDHNLTLGTVQLGINYGISNNIGKPDKDMSFKILSRAISSGISTFDTAQIYGDSEAIIGKYLENNNIEVNIITKLTCSGKKITKQELHDSFNLSLNNLNRSSVYGIMLHYYEDFHNNIDSCLDFFKDLKSTNKVIKTGVSVYNAYQIEEALKYKDIDILQAPMNLFDLEIYTSGLIDKLNSRNIEYYIRSVFLQGLFFLSEEDVKAKIPQALPFIKELDRYCKKKNIDKASLAINFISKIISERGKIVFGVDKPDQIDENIELLDLKSIDDETIDFFIDLSKRIPEVVKNPSLWRKK